MDILKDVRALIKKYEIDYRDLTEKKDLRVREIKSRISSSKSQVVVLINQWRTLLSRRHAVLKTTDERGLFLNPKIANHVPVLAHVKSATTTQFVSITDDTAEMLICGFKIKS